MPDYRERRIAAGFGLRHFAVTAGLLPSHYCRIENGQIEPTEAVRQRIEYYLGEHAEDHYPPKDPPLLEEQADAE